MKLILRKFVRAAVLRRGRAWKNSEESGKKGWARVARSTIVFSGGRLRLEIVRRINEIQSRLAYQRETTGASINFHPPPGEASSLSKTRACFLTVRLQGERIEPPTRRRR